MKWLSLEKVWKKAGGKSLTRVRFSDWTHTVKYFMIMKESKDGKKIIGVLDTGEKIAFPKKLQGWSLYKKGDEFSAHAV
jgi:hypothetical protein